MFKGRVLYCLFFVLSFFSVIGLVAPQSCYAAWINGNWYKFSGTIATTPSNNSKSGITSESAWKKANPTPAPVNYYSPTSSQKPVFQVTTGTGNQLQTGAQTRAPSVSSYFKSGQTSVTLPSGSGVTSGMTFNQMQGSSNKFMSTTGNIMYSADTNKFTASGTFTSNGISAGTGNNIINVPVASNIFASFGNINPATFYGSTATVSWDADGGTDVFHQAEFAGPGSNNPFAVVTADAQGNTKASLTGTYTGSECGSFGGNEVVIPVIGQILANNRGSKDLTPESFGLAAGKSFSMTFTNGAVNELNAGTDANPIRTVLNGGDQHNPFTVTPSLSGSAAPADVAPEQAVVQDAGGESFDQMDPSISIDGNLGKSGLGKATAGDTGFRNTGLGSTPVVFGADGRWHTVASAADVQTVSTEVETGVVQPTDVKAPIDAALVPETVIMPVAQVDTTIVAPDKDVTAAVEQPQVSAQQEAASSVWTNSWVFDLANQGKLEIGGAKPETQYVLKASLTPESAASGVTVGTLVTDEGGNGGTVTNSIPFTGVVSMIDTTNGQVVKQFWAKNVKPEQIGGANPDGMTVSNIPDWTRPLPDPIESSQTSQRINGAGELTSTMTVDWMMRPACTFLMQAVERGDTESLSMVPPNSWWRLQQYHDAAVKQGVAGYENHEPIE